MNSITNIDLIQPSIGLSDTKSSNAHLENSTNIEPAQSTTPNTSTKDWPEDKVSISAEAKDQLEEEIKEKEKIEDIEENMAVSDGSKSKSILGLAEELKQKVIDDLKERIDKASEELQKLKGQDDEGSKERVKLLQKQINDLNIQLLTMMTS